MAQRLRPLAQSSILRHLPFKFTREPSFSVAEGFRRGCEQVKEFLADCPEFLECSLQALTRSSQRLGFLFADFCSNGLKAALFHVRQLMTNCATEFLPQKGAVKSSSVTLKEH